MSVVNPLDKTSPIRANDFVPLNQPESQPRSGSLDGKSVIASQAPKLNEPGQALRGRSNSMALPQKSVLPSDPPALHHTEFPVLPDRNKLIQLCGQPPRWGFWNSRQYKAVLNELDKVHHELQHPSGQNAQQRIDALQAKLDRLTQALRDYENAPANRRFKPQMRELDQQVEQIKTALATLKSQNKGDWPPSLSALKAIEYAHLGVADLNQAISYAEHGILPQQAAEFNKFKINPDQADMLLYCGVNPPKDNALLKISHNPKQLAQQLGKVGPFAKLGLASDQIENLLNTCRSRKELDTKLYFDFLPKQLCEDGRKLREDVRLNHPTLKEYTTAELQELVEKAGTRPLHDLLFTQMRDAALLIADIFIKEKAVPPELANKTREQLADCFERLPMAKLPSAQQETVSKLKELCDENYQLLVSRYEGMDKRFAMPKYATQAFGHKEGNTLYDNPTAIPTLLEEKGKAKKVLNDVLATLMPADKLANEKTRASNMKGLLADLLDSKPDVRIAFGLLNTVEKGEVLSHWIDGLALSPTQKNELKKNNLGELVSTVASKLPKFADLKNPKQVGEGGFGKVFSAEYDGKPVIVKVIQDSPDPLENKPIKDFGYGFIIDEALRQSEMRDNPCAPKVLGVEIDETTGKVMMFIEKVQGKDYEKLFCETALTSEHKLALGIQCVADTVRGLETLHQRDLAHLDIKPANVMYDQHGAKLIDYGICAMKGDLPSALTELYAAPEVVAGQPEPASDIFSLGCMMYEQLTGLKAKNDSFGVYSLMSEGELFKDARWNSQPWKDCKTFIQACLETNPKTRPTSAQILLAVRGGKVTPAAPGGYGLAADKLGCLAIFRPESGHIAEARKLLAAKF